MHCVGMCGPIVLSYSTRGLEDSASFSASLSAHLLYNGGRVLSYTLVGGILGGIGSGILFLKDLGFWFSLISGILLVIMGLSLLRVVPVISLSPTISFDRITKNFLFRAYRTVYTTLITQKGIESKFYLGMLTPLLPCGLLYAMFIKAASAASVAAGALTMLCFGLGIVPALVVTGFASTYFGNRLRFLGDKVGAAMVLVMGIVLVARALGVPFPGGEMHHH